MAEMNLDALWQWLEFSPIGTFVAESSWAFPASESAHVVALVLVVGSIAIMDLRLLGVASKSCAVTELSSETLPWTWGAFVLAVITGFLLFSSNASGYAANSFFVWKMVLLVLAGLNMAVFHVFTWKSVHDWDADCAVPLAGKVAGGLSLIFWIAVITCGRWIGFTLGGYTF
jgi:hypothetical protein